MFTLFKSLSQRLFGFTNNPNNSPVQNIKKPVEIKTYDKSVCVDLASTAELLASIVITGLDVHDPDLVDQMEPDNIYPEFPQDVFNILLEFVYPTMDPSSDQIDSMLLVGRVLLAAKHNQAYGEFIFNCPKKFLLAYANNSERTPRVLSELKSRQMIDTYNHILAHTSDDKLITWYERNK